MTAVQTINTGRTARSRRYVLSLLLHALLVSGTVAILAGPLRPPQLPLIDAGLASAVFYVGTLPVALYFGSIRREPLPLLPAIGTFYAISFGLVMFSESVLDYPMPGWNLATWRDSLLISLVGLTLMLGAAYLSKELIFARLPRVTLPAPLDMPSRLRRLAWPLLVLHSAAVVFNWNNEIPTIGNFLESGAGYLSVGIFIYLWRNGHLSKMEKTVLVGFVLPLVVIGRFASGFLAQVIFFAAFAGVSYWYYYRQIPRTLLIGCVIFLVVFSPIKEAYRLIAWDLGRYQSSLSTIERAALMLELAGTYVRTAGVADVEEAITHMARRAANIVLLGVVVSSTPSLVPYWEGETYLPLLTKFVPRLLWEGKPREEFGNATGHRFGLLRADDEDTSINLNQLVEAYANFGWYGVFVVMTVIGVFLGLAYRMFNSAAANAPEVIMGMAVLFPLSFPESNVSIMYGGLIVTAVADYLILRMTLSLSLHTKSPASA